jgi:ArsR family transcriptional regulator, arsenate/arsenite/antimonite-responsive transcriptional repressor
MRKAMETQTKKDARVFKAFCDENRLRALELLRGGEKCACVLVERLGIGQSALSYHMKILVESGVVTARQEGKWTHYSISAEGSARAAALLNEITTPSEEQEEQTVCGK